MKKGTIGELKCFETHPLLINYAENKIVTLPADYYFSYTRNYAALENELEVTWLDLLKLAIGMDTVCKTALTIMVNSDSYFQIFTAMANSLNIEKINRNIDPKSLYKCC